MKVRELIEELSKMDGGAIVVLSKDTEGNGYSPLSSIVPGEYQEQSSWSGEFFELDTIGDDNYFQPDEDSVEAVCLWPTN
jgi:hypothetical protein